MGNPSEMAPQILLHRAQRLWGPTFIVPLPKHSVTVAFPPHYPPPQMLNLQPRLSLWPVYFSSPDYPVKAHFSGRVKTSTGCNAPAEALLSATERESMKSVYDPFSPCGIYLFHTIMARFENHTLLWHTRTVLQNCCPSSSSSTWCSLFLMNRTAHLPNKLCPVFFSLSDHLWNL